jgi:hypothetical protein
MGGTVTRIAVDGEARGATVATEFTFDPATGALQYKAAGTGIPAARMLGVWIQRGGEGEKGPVLYQLLGRGRLQDSGVISLPQAEHARLREGRFYLAVYTLGSPRGSARAQLTPR